jgi:hypothetical protein
LFQKEWLDVARRELNAKLHSAEVLVVDRKAIKARHLVYLLVADSPQRYPWKTSPILYVGTTAHGVARIAASAAHRADDIFARYGIRRFVVRVVTCPRRAGMQTWKVLEKDLMRRFKARHGEVPFLNEWKNLNPHHLSGYFSEAKLDKILKDF